MDLTGDVRKPVQIAKILIPARGNRGKVNPFTLCPACQHAAELLPIGLREPTKGIPCRLPVVRRRYIVGHLSVTVQHFPVLIAFRGRPLLETFQEILEPIACLTASQQHFQKIHILPPVVFH